LLISFNIVSTAIAQLVAATPTMSAANHRLDDRFCLRQQEVVFAGGQG